MSAKTGWINFRDLCKSVGFARVLELYNVELKMKRDQAQGFCPLPGHKGERRSPSFSVNIAKGIWQCFGCGSKGNILDFVARMEGLDPFKGKDVRKAAEILQGKVGTGSSHENARSHRGPHQPSSHQMPDSPLPSARDLPVVINPPLDFELKDLDQEHPYLLERGFTHSTIQTFGLGYCNRGMFKGRIAIPIHTKTEMLVGYAGRLVNDRAINAHNPKYKLPPPRERNGELHEFHKSLLLYNVHRLQKKCSDIIVVEGFPSVWWLWQHEYRNVVALMGSDCSEVQAKMILETVEFDGRIWIMTDGDEGGVRCATSLLTNLSPHRLVRWAKLKDGEQPTDLTMNDLEVLLNA